jgi:hypothetical protein
MNFAAKSIKAPFVEGLEGLSDERLVATLREVGTLGQIDSLNWSEYPYAPAVSFRIAHSDKAIAIMFEVRESNVKATTLDSNGPVWEDSCVEFFVANPKGEGYFNFEINCIGTALAAFRRSRSDAEHFSEEKIAKVRRFGSLPHAGISSLTAQTKASSRSGERLPDRPFGPKSHISSSSSAKRPACTTLPCP